MEEKWQKLFSSPIGAPILEDFNTGSTHMVQLRGGNHQMVQNFYFETIEGQSKTLNRKGAHIKKDITIPANIFIFIRGQCALVIKRTRVNESPLETTFASKDRNNCQNWRVYPRDINILFRFLTHGGNQFHQQINWYGVGIHMMKRAKVMHQET